MAYGDQIFIHRPPKRSSVGAPCAQRGTPAVPTSRRGMGARTSPLSLTAPSPVLVILVLFGVCLKSVLSCETEVCWQNYQVAEAELGRTSRDSADSEGRCMLLRTYIHCLENLHGCKGNINYHIIKKGIQKQMNQHNCDQAGPTFSPKENVPPIPPPDAVCSFQGKKVYRHCGLFGDPHLQTFNKEFQTCKVEGAWPLLDNEYLIVQVTNAPVSDSIGATATTKLTVLIKRNTECAENRYHTYQAQAGYLPGTFDDGQTAYGHSRSVELHEVSPGQHVEIYVRYIDTKILVRQVGAYLTFAIKMPEELINSSKEGLELCVHGCPSSEIIEYQRFLATQEREASGKVAMPRKQAENMCRSAGLIDFYFDSCVFDLMTTGSENFTVAAFSALEDLLRLAPDKWKEQKNRTSLEIYDEKYGGASSLRTTSLEQISLLLLTLFVSIFIKTGLPSTL